MLKDYLRRTRRAKDITQAQAATLAGCSHAAISQWERGQRRPTLASLHALCRALELGPVEVADAERLWVDAAREVAP